MLKSTVAVILAAGLLAGCVYEKNEAYAPPRDGGRDYARDSGNGYQRDRVGEPTRLTNPSATYRPAPNQSAAAPPPPPPQGFRTEDLGSLSPGSGTTGPDADTRTPPRATPSPTRLTTHTSTSSRLFVQAASFVTRRQAERARRSLGGLGHTEIYTAYVDHQLRYRVRVGPFRSPERTEEVRASLMRRGYNDAIIVRD